jgi:adenylosuccinate lyase
MLGHGLIAIKALLKGLGKIELNQEAIQSDLDQNPMVLAEAIQNILRTVQYPKPYEALKELTRGKHSVTLEDIHEFINQLDVDEELKSRLKSLRPEDYTGMPNPMPK